MHARSTWLAGSVRERETHARSDSSFSENDTSITRRGAAITISPSANPTKGDMDIVKPKRNPPRCVRIHGIDTLVTNGGYDSVNQAMSFGIPLVAARTTEDKADVNARVAWSGVGVDLATNEPTPAALREA